MKTVQKSKKDVLEFWRNLGFLYDLKEGGIIEWRCAKSFELMANFMMADENLGDKILETWSVAAFPILRHCLVKNSNRVTKVIDPKIFIDFLKNKKMRDIFEYIYGLKGLQEKKYMIKCFERYLETINKNDSSLYELFLLMDDEKEKIAYIFDLDFEAEICGFISGFFAEAVKKN